MRRLKYIFLPVLVLLLTGCDKTGNDSESIIPEEPIIPNTEGSTTQVPLDPERVDYILDSANGSGVEGVASFIPNDDGSTTIFIELENASTGEHPATINLGSVADSGEVAITLKTCTCQISETLVTELDNGTAITFVELMNFDGNLNIYESPSDGTVIAQTDIGSNAF